MMAAAASGRYHRHRTSHPKGQPAMKKTLRSLFVLLAATAATAAEPEVVKRWTFDAPDSAAGWVAAHDMANLHVADGRLCLELTGIDAYMTSPLFETPLDGIVVRIRMGCDHPGTTEVYWATKNAPIYDGQRKADAYTPARAGAPEGRDDLVTVELPIGRPADADKTLIAVRIDPYNGNPAGMVRIASIEILRRPAVYETCFAPAACLTAPSKSVAARLACRRVAGRTGGGQPTAGISADQSPLPAAEPLRSDSPTEYVLTRQLRFDAPGVHSLWSAVRADGQDFDLESQVIIGDGTTLPILPGLKTKNDRLDLIATAAGRSAAAARWQVADGEDAYRLAGWLTPLAEITFEDPSGGIVRRQPAFEIVRQSADELRLAGIVDHGGTWNIELTFQAADRGRVSCIEVSAKLTGPDRGKLLDFTGPVLRAERERPADPLERYAIFGGLEFLEPGWPSSSDQAVGPKFAERWMPGPFKVCLPLMTVEAAGLTTSLIWQPNTPWAKGQTMPAATFASPNFLDDQANHLMKLSVPSIGQWRSENRLWADEPLVTSPSQPLTLSYVLAGEANTPAVSACRRWYQVFGLPDPPPAPHDDGTTYTLYARHLGETMYWPADKGWRHHWFLEKQSGFSGWMAAELLAHAASTGDRRWVERTGIVGRSIIDAAGPLADRLAQDGAADAAIASMRPDGTWAYRNPPKMRENVLRNTGGQFDSLGKDGSTGLGPCTLAAMPIFEQALLTGQDKYVQASIKALEAMRQFRVPRGAQTWEVHKDIPDIRAAAQAVRAYQVGYRITGDRKYLEEANYWAWSGAPFLYSWRLPIAGGSGQMVAAKDRDAGMGQVTRFPLSEGFKNPERQVTPYGSIPVLGPTFYVLNWFGVIVQWCGLEWAWRVIELDADRPDELLRAIADGVVRSGQQQTFDREPWIGLYPDVWDPEKNSAQGAYICGLLPMRCLQAQGRLPAWAQTWTQVLAEPAGGRRWHVSGWGRPAKLAWPTANRPLIVPVEYLAGEANELVIAGADRPRLVRVDNQILQVLEGAKVTTGSWVYDAKLRAIVIRFVQPDRRATVRVVW
jgi:hypothetical protein